MFVTKKRIMRRLQRIEESLQEVTARVEQLMEADLSTDGDDNSPDKGSRRDKLLQEGIDNIMAFQAGKKRSESE